MNEYLTIDESQNSDRAMILINNRRQWMMSFSKRDDKIIISEECDDGVNIKTIPEKATEILKDIIGWIEGE